MKNYKIYLYTTLGFVFIYISLITFIIVPSVVKFQITTLLQNELDLSRQEVLQVSVLSGAFLSGGLEKKELLSSIQKAISGSDSEAIFLSVFDWSGNIASYPDITKVGEKNIQKSNAVSNMETVITAVELYAHILNKNKDEDTSEIIALKPISNSDLIIASHLNLKNFNFQINTSKSYFYNIFLVLGLVLLLLGLTIVRVVSINYEKIIEKKTVKFEDGVLNLSKLNSSLEMYQKNISELSVTKEAKEEIVAENVDRQTLKEFPKQRLLTYIRNELMPIAIEEISYIYVENTITYVVRRDGKRFTANDSLDQIYSTLDEKIFFRANRQIIVAIYAIDKIIKYGNSALKIEMKPVSEIDIIIGKNKTSIFKQWLDM